MENILENQNSLNDRSLYPFDYITGQTNLCYKILSDQKLGPKTYCVELVPEQGFEN